MRSLTRREWLGLGCGGWFLLMSLIGAWLVHADSSPTAPARSQPAGSLVIPAHAFDRGNVQSIASGSYADAEPVVINGGTLPNHMEYEIDFPLTGTYTLLVRYAAREARPVDVLLDSKKVAVACRGVSGSWQSSSAIWEKAGELTITSGKHTLRLECPGKPIPHIVAFKFESAKPFPAGWKLHRPTAARLDDWLGVVKGYDNGKDGYEAFVRDDGFVNVPNEYNPIIRFRRHPAPTPAAERILEYFLLGQGKYQVQARIVPSASAEADGWAAELSVQVDLQRTESGVLPLGVQRIRKMAEHTLRLVADFRETDQANLLEPERRQAQKVLQQLDALVPNAAGSDQLYQLYRDAYQLKNKVARANPLLRSMPLLFVKRQTYDTSHIYTTYFDGSHRFGGNLYVLPESRPDAQPRKLVAKLGDKGIYRDPDVSWDGQRVVFSFKASADSPCHLWEIGLDGNGLKQLTSSSYDDIDPTYLPDGRIMFVSTRGGRVVLCHNAFTVSVLHTMDAAGESIRCVSPNTVNEFTPSVAADGTLLYTRWEYVDKNVGNNQSLWRTRPDGTFAQHVAGAHWGPITFWEPRQVPGSDKIVCTLAPHMPIAVGPIALVDPHDVGRSPAKYTSLTPELPPPHHFGWHRNDVGYYCNPYPLSEKYHIVAYSYDADPRSPRGYGLYLLDRWGNRDLIYRDPETSCFEAMPAAARPRPPIIPDAPPSGDLGKGAFLMLDVYQGLTGIPRGEVKYLRVIEEVAKPVSAQCRGYGLQHPLISRNGNFAVKRVLGTVPVEADGSAWFEAPAGKALYFSALDENFMEVQRMRSFVHLAPGQTMTCVGCHEDRRTAPAQGLVQVVRKPVSAIQPPPEGTHAPDFWYDVQPVLNRHCQECHSGQRIEGGIDLSPDHTNLFSVAYETLTSGWVNYVDIHSSGALALRPPKYYGSHASKLTQLLRGKHKEYVQMPADDWRRLVTWIDCNAPYYGTYKYTRSGIGGRELVGGKVEKELMTVHQKRCSSCHAKQTERVKQVRLPNLEQSPMLRAPLAKQAGGTSRCGKPVFADRSDPDYQSMLTALRQLQEELKQNPREDMLSERPPIADEKAPYRYR